MMASNDLIIDVNRLTWPHRANTRSTGIDRLCCAYLALRPGGQRSGSKSPCAAHFRSRDVTTVFENLLAEGESHCAQVSVLACAATRHRIDQPMRGAVSLKVRHTDLDQLGLPEWIARHRLRPAYLIYDLIPISQPHYCGECEAAQHFERVTTLMQTVARIIASPRVNTDALDKLISERGLPKLPVVVSWLVTPPLRDPQPLVSIIVPTRDALDALLVCFSEIWDQTRYPAIELIVTDNASAEPAKHSYLAHIARDPYVHTVGAVDPMHHSRLDRAAEVYRFDVAAR